MRCHRLPLLLIVVFGLLAYANSLQGSLHFDDVIPIVENKSIKDLKNISNIFFESRGLVTATFALNFACGEFKVFGYHLFNMMLHVFNAIIIYFVFLKIFQNNCLTMFKQIKLKISFFISIMFLVHPIQTQSVTYIVQRYEVMASTFYLIAMLFFVYSHKISNNKLKILFYFLIIFFFCLGLKSKEIVVSLPVVMVLYDYCFMSEGRFGGLKARWPFYCILFTISLWFSLSVLIQFGGPSQTSLLIEQGVTPSVGFAVRSMSAWEYFLTQVNVILHYLSLILWPLHQNLDYDFPVAHSLFEAPQPAEGTVLNAPLIPPILALMLLTAICIWAFVQLNKSDFSRRFTGFSVLTFFLIIAPTSSFVPILDVINEHRIYLASVFILAPLVMGMERIGAIMEVWWRKRTGVCNSDAVDRRHQI